jgi:hypothetical protein
MTELRHKLIVNSAAKGLLEPILIGGRKRIKREN